MRLIIAATAVFAATLVFTVSQAPGSAEACAGLIGSNGAVNLGKTTTLAGYHDGVEHYVTAFEFQGGGGEFGTLIPLPAVPTKVERGGDWTLQRLEREVPDPQPEFFAADAAAGATVLERAEVLQEVRIDALDITILKGGSESVAVWATENGFRLSPDAPEVLEFYARRSQIFMAAVFDGQAATDRGQAIGDGTPVHLTMPTDNPWVPLRILGLGKKAEDRVDANVFLLTDEKPALLPFSPDSLSLAHSAEATDTLLTDLRTDAGGEWVPEKAWLTKISVNSSVADLKFDLAIDTYGNDPSLVDAGLEFPRVIADDGGIPVGWLWAAGLAALVVAIAASRRSAGARA